MKWLMQFEKAVAYVENNLSQEISLEEAAQIACCSTFYFRRMFTYVVGISLSEYIRRRRMTQAAFELQHGSTRIIDIAIKYGYTSPTAFNRAFQNVHGISPTAARQPGARLNAYPAVKFSIQVTGGQPMLYRIEEKAAMRIVGVRVPLTEDMDTNQQIAPAFWSDVLKDASLFDRICSLSDDSPGQVLGITACQGDNQIHYYIAAETDKPVPEGMYEYTVPASTWVIFECEGRFKESVQSIFRRFLTEWLPFSGYSYAELPDIEVYLHEKGKSGSGQAEVWIAIKKEPEV